MRCGARWPCVSRKGHKYTNTCPEGWSLKSGSICQAPLSYKGPCERTIRMDGMSTTSKKELEATCNASWPSMHAAACVRDYDAACPYGWFQSRNDLGRECRAPETYIGCASPQSFDGMTPHEKAAWEASCHQRFPCLSRAACDKDWSAPCPAEWFEFNAGRSCLAPRTYAGQCPSVMNGISAFSIEEKEATAQACGATWPCFGETVEANAKTQILQDRSPVLRSTADPAEYAPRSGPIDYDSGAIHEQSDSV